jgi:Fe-S-cluster containining protein
MNSESNDDLKPNEISIDIPEAEEFPQYLCKNCGQCCLAIPCEFSYEELKSLIEAGNEEIKEFIEVFKPYSSIEEAKKAAPEKIEQMIALLKERKIDIDKVTFYYCPHLSQDNLCSIYETRPERCKKAPRHGWSLMPSDCGFEGWQFEQREKHKKLIRSLKEYLYVVENLSKDGSMTGQDVTIDELRKNIEEKIKPWEKFGSMFW